MRLSVQFVENDKKLSGLFNKFENDKRLSIQFDEFEKDFIVSFGNYYTVTEFIGGSPYGGDYTVTPKVTEQTMPTKEKAMLDDVTILAIPYYDVENTAGGSTIFIGNEVLIDGN